MLVKINVQCALVCQFTDYYRSVGVSAIKALEVILNASFVFQGISSVCSLG